MKEVDQQTLEIYQSKINRVFIHVDNNLQADLSLDVLSKVAHFSPYHFHRVFKYITNETLTQYITRRKVEKAASELIRSEKTITDISLTCGFNDNSSFSRTFKKFYGINPTEFRKQNPDKHSKIRQLQSKNGQEYPDNQEYLCIINNLKKWIMTNASIDVKVVEKMQVAYVPCIGMGNIEQAYNKVMRWAIPKGLLHDDTKMITVYFDSLKITEAEKIRMNACILLTRSMESADELEVTSIPKSKTIVARFEIGMTEFEKSWTGLFVWMNDNGYKRSNNNPYAIYHNNYNEHPEKKAIVDLCIPVL